MLAGGEQIAFGIKDFEIIGHAFAVAQARQSRDTLLCGDALFLRGDDPASRKNAKWLALIATSATFLISLFLLAGFDSGDTGFQFVEDHAWIMGLRYKMGVDGISILFQ